MIISLKRHFAYICVVLCSLLALLSSTLAKPSLSAFSLPTPFSNFPSLSALTQDFVERKHAEQMKSYRWVIYLNCNIRGRRFARCRWPSKLENQSFLNYLWVRTGKSKILGGLNSIKLKIIQCQRMKVHCQSAIEQLTSKINGQTSTLIWLTSASSLAPLSYSFLFAS